MIVTKIVIIKYYNSIILYFIELNTIIIVDVVIDFHPETLVVYGVQGDL